MDQNPTQPGDTPEQPRQETPPVTPAQGQPQQPEQPQTTIYSGHPAQPPQQPTQPVYGAPQQPYPQQGNPQQPYQPYPPQQGTPGAPQQPYQPQQPYPPQYAPLGYAQAPRKQGGVPIWVWIIGGILGLILLACGVSAYVFTRAVSTTVEQSGKLFSAIASDMSTMGVINATSFYSDLSSSQYETARQYLTQQMKDKYSADKLRTDWEKLTGSGNTISPGIPDFSQLGSKQTQNQVLTETLDGSNGKTYTIKLNMKQVNNDWFIDGADPALIPAP